MMMISFSCRYLLLSLSLFSLSSSAISLQSIMMNVKNDFFGKDADNKEIAMRCAEFGIEYLLGDREKINKMIEEKRDLLIEAFEDKVEDIKIIAEDIKSLFQENFKEYCVDMNEVAALGIEAIEDRILDLGRIARNVAKILADQEISKSSSLSSSAAAVYRKRQKRRKNKKKHHHHHHHQRRRHKKKKKKLRQRRSDDENNNDDIDGIEGNDDVNRSRASVLILHDDDDDHHRS
jgi:hypothetical protein